MTVLSILIVGSGTAGWLTANHLAKRFSADNEARVEIRLIDSAEIPSIGVGEGTVPAIRSFRCSQIQQAAYGKCYRKIWS